MGFFIDGLDPRNEKGDYFHNNVCWWRPLWNYICCVSNDVLDENDRTMGHCNNDHIISESKADKIAKRLIRLAETGEMQEAVRQYENWRKSLPEMEECYVCEVLGRDKCGHCDGSGKEQNWKVEYSMSVENVKEFIEFVRNSGGFIIS